MNKIKYLSAAAALLLIAHPVLAQQNWPAHAHAQLVGQLALGQVWVVLQDAHDPKMSVFLDLNLSAGHRFGQLFGVVIRSANALGRLPKCRVTIG